MNELTDDYPGDSNHSTDTLLIEAMREYQAAIDAGRAPERSAFLARHPAVTHELADCLDGFRYLHNLLPVAEPAVATGVPLGDFQIVRELGRGGMGVVYEAEQLSLRRRVALKVLPFASTLDARQLQRFRTEATAAAHLHHPNVVQVYGVGCERGVHYYAMQYIEGRTLADVIRGLMVQSQSSEPAVSSAAAMNAETVRFAPHDRSTRGKASLREFFRTAARWGVQAADALEHAHQLGVIHRDIKPANLMIDSHGELHVTDFGLAHVRGSDQLTHTGDVVGTLRYMSPEQARGDRVADPRSDVYSLGITLYQLLTISTPFASSDRHTVLRQVLEDDPPPIHRLQPSVPAELGVIVQKAMAKVPSERYASALAMADDLRAWLEDRPIRGRPPTLGQRASKWARRHRAAVTAAAVAALLISAALAVSSILIAAKHGEVIQALQQTDKSLRSESQARSDLARTLDRETQTAYGYRLPLAQRAWRDGNPRRADELLADCPPMLRGWEWHYLNRKLDEAAVTLLGANAGKVAVSVEFVPQERTIRAHSLGATGLSPFVQSWNTESLKAAGDFQAPDGSGDRLELSSDGRRCAVFRSALDPAATAAKTVNVFDVTKQEKFFTFTAPAGIASVRFSPDGAMLGVAGMDGSMSLIDCASGAQKALVRSHTQPIVDFVWHPDGRSIASLGFEETARAAEFRRGAGIGHLRVWNVDDGAVRWEQSVALEPPLNQSGRWLRKSPRGHWLSVAIGLTVPPLVLNFKTGEKVALPSAGALRAFSDDDQRGLLIFPDRSAQVFDLEPVKPLARWRLHEPERVKSGSFELNRTRMAAAFNADGSRAAFGHDDGRISIWDTATGQEVVTLPGEVKTLSLAFDADSAHLAASGTDRSVVLWNLAAAGENRQLAKATIDSKFQAIAVSPDGRTLAALRAPNRQSRASGLQIVLWDLPSGTERRRIPAPELGGGWVTPGGGSLRFSADGERIAVAGLVSDGGPTGQYCRTVALWDVSTGRSILARSEPVVVAKQFMMHESEPLVPSTDLDDLRLQFDSNGRALVQLTAGGSIESNARPAASVSVVDQPAPIFSVPADSSWRYGVLSPNGRLCAVIPRVRTTDVRPAALELWNVAENRRLWELTSDNGQPLLAVAFSPDGRRLLTQPRLERNIGPEVWQHRAVVWDVETGQPICDFSPPSINGAFGEKVHARFAFSADNSRLVSCAASEGVTVWDATTGRELLTLGEFGGVIAEAHFSRDGLLITRAQDGVIAVWDGRGMK